MCMAAMVSTAGDHLASELPAVLKVLLDRLRNDITRTTAARAFTLVPQSSLPLDLTSVLVPVTEELTAFLRKANRVLRQTALSALEVRSALRAAAGVISCMRPAALLCCPHACGFLLPLVCSAL